MFINREVYDASFENIKLIFLGVKPMTISIILSVILKSRGKVTVFHDALHYLASVTEVKSTSRLR